MFHISLSHSFIYSIDIRETVRRVSQLFSGYPHLIEGFNTFLLRERRIELSLGTHTSRTPSFKFQPLTLNGLKFHTLIHYLKKVDKEFGLGLDRYTDFLNILADFQTERYVMPLSNYIFLSWHHSYRIDALDFVWHVSKLFPGFPALIEGINSFLPDKCYVQYFMNGGINCVTVINPPEEIMQSKNSGTSYTI